MKKVKFSTLFLLLIALLIWGVIAWRIATTVSFPVSFPDQKTIAEKVSKIGVKKLRLGYKDPFLRYISEKKEEVQPEEKITVSENPPAFIYKGRINKGERVLVLLEKEGNTFMANVQETVEGFCLERVCLDTLFVSKNQALFILLLE